MSKRIVNQLVCDFCNKSIWDEITIRTLDNNSSYKDICLNCLYKRLEKYKHFEEEPINPKKRTNPKGT